MDQRCFKRLQGGQKATNLGLNGSKICLRVSKVVKNSKRGQIDSRGLNGSKEAQCGPRKLKRVQKKSRWGQDDRKRSRQHFFASTKF